MVHLTEQVAWTAEEKIVGKGGADAQIRQIFDDIAALLKMVGGELADIRAITAYLTDSAQLPAIQKVETEYLQQGH